MINSTFYPTPREVIRQMIQPFYAEIAGLNRTYSTIKGKVLEPSAGKGDIVDYLVEQRIVKADSVYCVESEQTLRDTLHGKNYQVVGTDFLEFDEPYDFQFVLMNPPFKEGAKHLLHAWSILNDGKIACVLNAETVRNPYTDERKRLKTLIDAFGEVKFIGQAFIDAERKTSVETCIVWLTKESAKGTHEWLDPSKFEADAFDHFGTVDNGVYAPLASGDLLESLEASYKRAMQLVRERHQAEKELAFHLSAVSADDSHRKIEESLDVELSAVKTAYWRYIFTKTGIANRLTSAARAKFFEMQQQYYHMAFSAKNVMELVGSFILNSDVLMHQCAEEVAEIAMRYHKDNRVYKEGWKTNKYYEIHKKIIIPPPYYGLRYKQYDFTDDLEKVLGFLSGINVNSETFISVRGALAHTSSFGDGHQDEASTTFFDVKTFKKGTMHITFKDQDLLDALNIFANGGKKWVKAA